ncbi:hypothetical protein Tco_1008717, partial [Tanacetum coccineum]
KVLADEWTTLAVLMVLIYTGRARATGAALGTKSIWNSTFQVSGNPGNSSGKTSRKSRMIGTSSSRFSSDLSLVPFFPLLSPWTIKTSSP